jgi:hypothetical protein
LEIQPLICIQGFDRMPFKPSKLFGFESLKGFETFFVGLEPKVCASHPYQW